jgi:hypothetical protein
MYCSTVDKKNPIPFPRPKTVFVQPDPCNYCQDAGLFNLISEQQGYRCKCRNPRCSYECRRAWAEREAWMLRWRFKQLPQHYQQFRGCLKLAKDANADDHQRVLAYFNKQLAAARKKYGCTIELVRYAHDTDPYNRHYDFVGYTDRPDIIRQIIHDAGPNKICNITTCILFPREQTQRWTNYTVKANQWPGKHGKYIFLPAVDGSRLQAASKGFWGCTKAVREAAWTAAGKEAAEKALETPPPDPKESVREQVKNTMPERAEEAATIGKLCWGIRWPNGVHSRAALLKELFDELPVKRLNAPGYVGEAGWLSAQYYLLDPRQRTHAEKMWGRGPIHYHAKHWPLPPDPDEVIDHLIGTAEPWDRDQELCDEDFLRELDAIRPVA